MTSDHAPASAGVTRREVLAGVAGAGAIAVGVAGTAAGQEGTFLEAAIGADAPRLGEADYVGLFLHLGRPAGDATDPPPGVAACGFVDDDRVRPYEAVLIDRSGDEPTQAETTVYLPADDEREAGSLYIVNKQSACGEGFEQLRLERIGAANLSRDTGVSGPGFGVGLGVASVLGAGELLRRRGD